MIQPRTSFLVAQLPSPLSSFFKEMASFRCVSSKVGRARISSIAWRR